MTNELKDIVDKEDLDRFKNLCASDEWLAFISNDLYKNFVERLKVKNINKERKDVK